MVSIFKLFTNTSRDAQFVGLKEYEASEEGKVGHAMIYDTYTETYFLIIYMDWIFTNGDEERNLYIKINRISLYIYGILPPSEASVVFDSSILLISPTRDVFSLNTQSETVNIHF